MLAFPDMLDFFADEFARLSAWSFPLTRTGTCALDCFFLWHRFSSL
jgi:hypothetical protein